MGNCKYNINKLQSIDCQLDILLGGGKNVV